MFLLPTLTINFHFLPKVGNSVPTTGSLDYNFTIFFHRNATILL